MAIENHDVFHKLGDADVLSHADQYRVIFIFATDLRNREFEYFQYKSGSLDENTWKSYKDLGTERTLSWWVSIGRGGFSKKLLALWMRSFKTNPITHIEKIL